MFESMDALSSKLAATGYYIDPVMTQVVYLAARMRKPVLLEGPAGSGKRHKGPYMYSQIIRPDRTGICAKSTCCVEIASLFEYIGIAD